MKKNKSNIFVFDKDVARSKAYRSLKLTASFIVYNEFLMRRVIVYITQKRGKKAPVIINNGEIEFKRTRDIQSTRQTGCRKRY